LHLDPFPLLVENGRARVAVAMLASENTVGAGAETP